MDTFTRDGLVFDLTDAGPRDGRVVIALHGFPEDRHCWSAMLPALTSAGYRVLAPDQRGYSPGARPAGRRPYVIDELTRDVLALADAAGVERFDLIGHDWGGLVAWDLAARSPERVRTLTSLSTPHPRAVRDAVLRGTQGLHSWYVLFFQLPRVPEAFFRLTGAARATATLERSGLDHDTASRYAARMTDSAFITPALNWYRAIPLASRNPTPRVDVPTLYVWSDGDTALTRRAAEGTAKYVTAPYRFEIVAGMSHWLPSGAPERVTPLVLDHLASVPAAA